MNAQVSYLNKRRLLGVAVAVVIVVGVVGMVVIIDNTPTTYHYEAWLPGSGKRDTRFTIAGIAEANITVSFSDEPNLWYRLEITHYSSIKKHAVENADKPTFLPLRVHVLSSAPVKNINLVLGTDVGHSLYISGENLNTIVILGNGAKISGTRCRLFGTGVFQFFMTEDVNFTTEGMDVEFGDGFFPDVSSDLVILDINLPEGMNGHLSARNMTSIQNEWPIHYDDEWGTPSIDDPLIDIEVFYSRRVWANLRL